MNLGETIIPPAQRSPLGPLLEPRQGEQYWWESHGVFNPGVAEYQGSTLLLYRAYDSSYRSRLGLAESQDGVTFVRDVHPVIDINAADPLELLGLEDPRITQIGDIYYILHTAASHYQNNQTSDVIGVGETIPWKVRVAMHTTKDFRSFVHASAILPEIPAKNACLLPLRDHDGMFGLYLRVRQGSREVLQFARTPDFKQWHDMRDVIWPKIEPWQTYKIGFGSQPIEVTEGFLMVYHAVDEHRVYRLGLMLCDRDDPSRILWSSSNPILEPTMVYERQGYVPNVVFCCGAIRREDELWIYYGGADRVIGRAILSLKGIVT